MPTKTPTAIATVKPKTTTKTTGTSKTAIKGSSLGGSSFVTSRFRYPPSYTSDFIKSLK